MPFIDVRNVSYSYEPSQPSPPGLHGQSRQSTAGEGTQGLSGVDLAIERGEYLAIVGANGSGKSTLAYHLNGLLLPSAGSISVDGLDTRRPRDLSRVRQLVGMVFQKPEEQVVGATVEEDVAFGPENLKVPRPELRLRVDRALEQAGLTGLAGRSPHELSDGQKQRLAIAGVLALEPRAIVLDEATSMLDPSGRRELLALLARLNRAGITIVHITHHMEEAAAAARIVVLHQGSIVAEGSPSALFTRPDLAGFGLRHPDPLRLAERLARRGAADLGRPLSYQALAESIGRLRAQAVGGLTAVPGGGPEAESAEGGPARASANASSPQEAGGRRPLEGSQAVIEVDSLRASEPPLVRLASVGHRYRADRRATANGDEASGSIPSLRSINLAVRRGEAVALIGPTGSGKSTLLQHLDCLFLPQEGLVEIDGQPVSPERSDLPAIRRRIALLFQRAEEQLFEQYVGDEVAYGPRLAGLAGKALTERVRWAMEAAGLPFDAYRDRLTFALSGGEQRKVALAGVLALRPEALLLDEPTAGLDPASREELLALLERLKREGTTIVFSTHDIVEAGRIADRIVVLAGGEIRLDLPTRALFARGDALAELGLETPGFVRLLERLVGTGWLRSDGEPGGVPDQLPGADPRGGPPVNLEEAEERLAALLKGWAPVAVTGRAADRGGRHGSL